jgi:hypothetical protein
MRIPTRFPVSVAALLVLGALAGCSREETNPIPVPGTGGAGGGAPRPSPSGTGGAGGSATAGTGGGSGAGGGGAAGSGGGGAAGSGGGGARTPDAGTRDTAVVADAPPRAPDGGGTPDGPGGVGSDAGVAVLNDAGLAICFSNPLVVATCRQLEAACENCPPGGAPPRNQTAQRCFDLVEKAVAGMATDGDCVKFFADNKCFVDQGGNACGSLNCTAAGCNTNMCNTVSGNGDSTACQRLLNTCPCR